MDKLQYEQECVLKGYRFICGIDEVGRGPLAGPVVACACIMDLTDIVQGVDDSKKLSEKKREKLFEEIKSKAICYSICEIDHEEIDKINILNATKKCMLNCINSLEIKPDILLIDAVKLDTDIEQLNIIKGDAKSYSIGCASILAKVYRDRLMKEYAKEFPMYAFDKNAGYGTKVHREAIMEYGPCKIQRKTFIKNFWDGKGN
jgi:ribonuclease HII